LTAEDPDGFGTEEESASRPLSGSPSDLIEFNLSMPEPRKNGARRLSQKHAAKRRVRLRRQIRRSSYAVATRREGHRSPRSDREVQRQRGKLSNTSAWLRRLLRPRRCRAAEQRDELAAFQLIELHSVPSKEGHGVTPSVATASAPSSPPICQRQAPFKPHDAAGGQSLTAAALPNQERPRKEAPREEGDRQLPPTSHLEIRQFRGFSANC
jgi:hypothetical protein